MVITLFKSTKKGLKITGNLMIRRNNPTTTVKQHFIEDSTNVQPASMQEKQEALIIDADPDGIIAAYELLRRTTGIPILLEQVSVVVGNVEDYQAANINDRNYEENKTTPKYTFNSRIYFKHKKNCLPPRLSFDTCKKIRFGKTIAALRSYLLIHLFPKKTEQNLEESLVNQFGYAFYDFFKDYFEKICGIPCSKLTGGMNFKSIYGISKENDTKIDEITLFKDGLFEKFAISDLQPNQLWREVVKRIEILGGKILLNSTVNNIYSRNNATITTLSIDHAMSGSNMLTSDYLISLIPIKGIIQKIDFEVPVNIKDIAKA